MARRFFVFDTVDRFVTGTVGTPGHRTFFLQAVQGPRVVSVQLEKVQVAVLAQRMGQILMELDRRGVAGVETAVAVEAPAEVDDRPLDEPLRDEFGVGTLTIGWDTDDSVMVIEARSESEEEDEEEVEDSAAEGPDVMRVRLSPVQSAEFVRRANRVLSSGRPPCPFCGQPLNPEGHICPRTNGYLN
ncbi:MAG: hypothetical protein QOH61_2211 [Chloroflexota bacterium]|jgi:uncharacterized repeat protein (TIGR03847 family)|nr:hypothetical protein [Chloroflexota bacterium]